MSVVSTQGIQNRSVIIMRTVSSCEGREVVEQVEKNMKNVPKDKRGEVIRAQETQAVPVYLPR